MPDLDGNDDFFDSRDVIQRIAELEAIGVIDREPDEQDELDALAAFAEEAEHYCADWYHGETFISENYFEDYAEEMAYDIGAVNRDADWPLSYIDWKAAADALLQDYTEFTLHGTTYYAR